MTEISRKMIEIDLSQKDTYYNYSFLLSTTIHGSRQLNSCRQLTKSLVCGGPNLR